MPQTDRSPFKKYKIAPYKGYFQVNHLSKDRTCFYLECGESTTKLIGEWYEFQYIENNNVIKKYPSVECADIANICFNDFLNFEFCGDVFVPVFDSEKYLIDGRRASEYRCNSKIVIKV
jgi:hypothetical protein